MFFLRAFWSAMFLYKSILYSALTFAHTRGLQQKLLLKIMEILTFLFAFDWINLQYFKPLKRDLNHNREPSKKISCQMWPTVPCFWKHRGKYFLGDAINVIITMSGPLKVSLIIICLKRIINAQESQICSGRMQEGWIYTKAEWGLNIFKQDTVCWDCVLV